MWYYHAQSGVGEALLRLKATPPRRIGVVGLGAGTIAAYAEKGDVFRFYDINSQVVDFAERQFTYLEDARERGTEVTTIEGDARRSLEQGEPQAFDMLVLDAFNGDAIPVHLLTLEAFDAYLRKLAPTASSPFTSPTVISTSTPSSKRPPIATSSMRRCSKLPPTWPPASSAPPPGSCCTERPATSPATTSASRSTRDGEPVPPVTWTDDYSDVVEILKW